MLQASDDMRVPVRGAHGVERGGRDGSRPGLRHVEQRPEAAVLQLRVVQGRAAGEPQARVEEGQRHSHRLRRRPHLCLPHRLQRLQECSNGGALRQIQAGMGLINLIPFFSPT